MLTQTEIRSKSTKSQEGIALIKKWAIEAGYSLDSYGNYIKTTKNPKYPRVRVKMEKTVARLETEIMTEDTEPNGTPYTRKFWARRGSVPYTNVKFTAEGKIIIPKGYGAIY